MRTVLAGYCGCARLRSAVSRRARVVRAIRRMLGLSSLPRRRAFRVGFVLSKSCRVGKGVGTVSPYVEASRAPCPPTESMRVARLVVGTAHDSPERLERECQAPLPTLQGCALR